MADLKQMVLELDGVRRTTLDTLPADEWIERSSDAEVLWLRMNEINAIMLAHRGTMREGAMRGSGDERLAWIDYLEALAGFKMALKIALMCDANWPVHHVIQQGLTWGRDEFIEALTELKAVIYESESE